MKTVSLELAKQLKESGFPQDECGQYIGIKGGMPLKLTAIYNGYVDSFGHWHARDEFAEFYAAPTAEEILEMLPSRIVRNETGYFLKIEKLHIKDDFHVEYSSNSGYPIATALDKSLAEAAGKMYLYLAKEGLLSQ